MAKTAADDAYLNFDFPAFIMAVAATLCFLLAHSIPWGFLCIIAGILFILYTLKINSLSRITVIVPFALILFKEIIRSSNWNGFWMTIIVVISIIAIWAMENNILSVKESAITAVMIECFFLTAIAAIVSAIEICSRAISTVSRSVILTTYYAGLFFMLVSLLLILSPGEKRSGRIKGSMHVAVSLNYVLAIVMGIIGLATTDTFYEALADLKLGRTLFGSFMDYALEQSGDISETLIYVLIICAAAMILEAVLLFVVNFLIHHKNKAFFGWFIFDAILIIVSVLVILIGTQYYIAGAVVTIVLAILFALMARYFMKSPTSRRYFADR